MRAECINCRLPLNHEDECPACIDLDFLHLLVRVTMQWRNGVVTNPTL